MDTAHTRIFVAACVTGALGASFMAGAAWHDARDTAGGSANLVAGGARFAVVNGPGALDPVGSCEELLDWYVDNTVDLVGPWGWGGYPIYYDADLGVVDRIFRGVQGVAADAPLVEASNGLQNGLGQQSSSETGTNVQEAGVDESDVVKTNGSVLVRVEGDDVTTYDVSGRRARPASTVDLPGGREVTGELLLVGDRAVVITQEYAAGRVAPDVYGSGGNPTTRVTTIDLADPEEPEIVSEQEYGASLVSARQYGDTIRLALGTGLPDLDFVHPGRGRTDREATRKNREILRESEIEDWLPSVSDDGDDAELAVGCNAMNTPEDFSGGGSVVVVGYDAASPTERDAAGVATTSSTVYSSTDRLYLATSPSWWGPCCVILQRGGWNVGPVSGEEGVTTLHAFELDGTTAAYVASGEVEGAVRDRWSMDAVDGVLRVAVGATSETGNFNSVVTLREDGDRLVELGRVDRLGVNEEIKAVRWFDDLAIVVTFRQTDPLYAIDLANPARPRALGELKIPGFSEYLHPIGDDLMIGIGTDASLSGVTRGGQAAVFDLADLRDPRRVSHLSYGRNWDALAGQDPRQFTWLPERRTALTVVSSYGKSGGMTGRVSVLSVGPDGSLTNRMLHGTYGYDDVARLRTVPLPDGRVVLVTEDSARFLDL